MSVKIHISGEFHGSFHEFKEQFENHRGLIMLSDEQKEAWLKENYERLHVKQVKEVEKEKKVRG